MLPFYNIYIYISIIIGFLLMLLVMMVIYDDDHDDDDDDDDVIICSYHFLTYSVSCSMVMIIVIIMAMANGGDIFDRTLPVLSRRRNGSKQRRRPWMTTATVVIAFGLYRLVVENGVFFFTGQ